MFQAHMKGERRRRLDLERIPHLVGDFEHPREIHIEGEEPARNQDRNRTLNCRFPKGGKGTRKKGRNRFKTGHKTQKKRKG